MDGDVTVGYSIMVPADMVASVGEKMKNLNLNTDAMKTEEKEDVTVSYTVKVPTDIAVGIGDKVNMSTFDLKHTSDVWEAILATQRSHSSVGRVSRNDHPYSGVGISTLSIPQFASVVSWEIPSLTLANSCLLIITSSTFELKGFFQIPLTQVSTLPSRVISDKVQVSAPIPGSVSVEDVITIHMHDAMESARLLSCLQSGHTSIPHHLAHRSTSGSVSWVPVRTPAVVSSSPIPKRDVSLVIDPSDDVFDYDLSLASAPASNGLQSIDGYQSQITNLIQQELESRSRLQADESLEKYNSVTVEFQEKTHQLQQRQQLLKIEWEEEFKRKEMKEAEFDTRTVIMADRDSSLATAKATIANHEKLSPTKRVGTIVSAESEAHTIGCSLVRHTVQDEARQNPSLDHVHRESFSMGLQGFMTLPSDIVMSQHAMTAKIMFTRGKRCRSAFCSVGAATGDMESFWKGVQESIPSCIESWEQCQGPSPILSDGGQAPCSNDASAEATLVLHKISELAGGGTPEVHWAAVMNPPWTIHERCTLLVTSTEIHICKKDALSVQHHPLSAITSFIVTKSNDWLVVVMSPDQNYDLIVRPIASSVNTIITIIQKIVGKTISTTIISDIDEYVDSNSERIHSGPGYSKRLLPPNVNVRIGPVKGFTQKELAAAKRGIEITSDLLNAHTTSQQRQTAAYGILGNEQSQLPAIQLVQSCELEPVKSFWDGVQSVCTAALWEPIQPDGDNDHQLGDPEWKQHLDKEVAILRKRLRSQIANTREGSPTVVPRLAPGSDIKHLGMAGVYPVRADSIHPVEIMDDRCDLPVQVLSNQQPPTSQFVEPNDKDIIDIIKPFYCGNRHSAPSVLFAGKVTHIGPSRSSHRVAIIGNNGNDNSLYLIQGGYQRPTRVRRCIQLSGVDNVYQSPDNAVGVDSPYSAPVVVQFDDRESCSNFSSLVSRLTSRPVREIASISQLYNKLIPAAVAASECKDVVFPIAVVCVQHPKVTTKTVVIPQESYAEALLAFPVGNDSGISSFLKDRLHDDGDGSAVHPAVLWGAFLHNADKELLIITSTSVTVILSDSLSGYSVPLKGVSQVIISPTSVAIPTLSGGSDGLHVSISDQFPVDTFLEALSRACGRDIPFIEVPHESNIGVEPSRSVLLPITMLGCGTTAVRQVAPVQLPRTPPAVPDSPPQAPPLAAVVADASTPKKIKKAKKEKKKKIESRTPPESDVDSPQAASLGALIPPPLQIVKMMKGGRVETDRKKKRRNIPVTELVLDAEEYEVEGASRFFSILRSSISNLSIDVPNRVDDLSEVPEVLWTAVVTPPIPEGSSPALRTQLQNTKYVVFVSTECIYIANGGGRLCRCIEISELREGYIDGKGSIAYRVNNQPDVAFVCRSSAKAAELCHCVSMLSSSSLFIRDWVSGISATFSTENPIKQLPVVVYTSAEPTDFSIGAVGLSTKTVPSGVVRPPAAPVRLEIPAAPPLVLCSPTPPDLPMDVLNKIVESRPIQSTRFVPLPLPPQSVPNVSIRPPVVSIQPSQNVITDIPTNQQSIKHPVLPNGKTSPHSSPRSSPAGSRSGSPVQPEVGVKMPPVNPVSVASVRQPHPASDVKIPPVAPPESIPNVKIPVDSIAMRKSPPRDEELPIPEVKPEVSPAAVQLSAEISILKLKINEQALCCKNLTSFARRYTDDVLLGRRSENANSILIHQQCCLQILEDSTKSTAAVELPIEMKEAHIPILDITSNVLNDEEASDTILGLIADDGSVPIIHFLSMVTVTEVGPTFLDRILALGDRALYTITREGAVDRCLSGLSLTKIIFAYTPDNELTTTVGVKTSAEWDFHLRFASFTEAVSFRLLLAALCPGIDICCVKSDAAIGDMLNLNRPVDYHLALDSNILKMNYTPNFFGGGGSPSERFMTPTQASHNLDVNHVANGQGEGQTFFGATTNMNTRDSRVATVEGSPRTRRPRHTWDLETSLGSIPRCDLPEDFAPFVPTDIDPIFYKDVITLNGDSESYAVLGRHSMVLINSSGTLVHKIKFMNIVKVVDKDLVMTVHLRRGDHKTISWTVPGESEGRELSSILSTLFRHASGGDVLTITGEDDGVTEQSPPREESAPTPQKPVVVVTQPAPELSSRTQSEQSEQSGSHEGGSVSQLQESVSEVGATGGLRIPDEKSEVTIFDYSKRTSAIRSPLPPPAPPVSEPLAFLPLPSNYNPNTVNGASVQTAVPPPPPPLPPGSLHPTPLPMSTYPLASVVPPTVGNGDNYFDPRHPLPIPSISPLAGSMTHGVTPLGDVPPAITVTANAATPPLPPRAPSQPQLASRRSQQRLSASQPPLVTSATLPPELKAFAKLLTRDGQQAVVQFIAPCLRISPGRPDEPRVTLISDKVIYQMTHQTRVNRCIQVHTISEVLHTPTGLLGIRVPTEFDLLVRLSAASCSDAVRVLRTMVEDFGYDIVFTQLSASLHPSGMEAMMNTARPEGWVPTRGSVVPLKYVGRKLSKTSKVRQDRTQSPIRSIRKSELTTAPPPPPPQPTAVAGSIIPPPPVPQNLTQEQIEDILFNDPL